MANNPWFDSFVASGGYMNPNNAQPRQADTRFDPYIRDPNRSNNPSYYNTPEFIPNPMYSGGGGGVSSFGGGGGNLYGANSSFGGRTSGNASSYGDVFSNVTGGGSVNFGGSSPEGFNPYQFTPVFQNLQRPESPVAPLTPEEEYLRQYQMGLLLGDQPGYDTAYNELLNTVGGEYLHPDSNPYLGEQINAIGADTTNFLNEAINNILSRAGSQGALGGSRSALLQGQAGGEATRGFNKTIADLLSGNYQQERNRQLGAIPGLLDVENLPIAQAAQAMQLAGIPREMQQQLINAQMGELLRMQNERLMPLQVGQSILGQRMGQTVPIASQQPSTLAGLGSLASGIGSLMGGVRSLGSIFSNPATQNVTNVPSAYSNAYDVWDAAGGFGDLGYSGFAGMPNSYPEAGSFMSDFSGLDGLGFDLGNMMVV